MSKATESGCVSVVSKRRGGAMVVKAKLNVAFQVRWPGRDKMAGNWMVGVPDFQLRSYKDQAPMSS